MLLRGGENHSQPLLQPWRLAAPTVPGKGRELAGKEAHSSCQNLAEERKKQTRDASAQTISRSELY